MCSFIRIELLTYCIMGNHFHALVHVLDPKVWLQQFEGPATQGLNIVPPSLLTHGRPSTTFSSYFMTYNCPIQQ